VRLAFLSPLPPAASGIADYAADVLQLLAGRHEIEVFHDQDAVDSQRLPRGCAVARAAAFLDRQRERPFDLAVYQLGNGPAHDFLYPLLPRLPGLLVLHDLVLHHARARAFLDTPAARSYAAEPSNAVLRAAALAPLGAYRAELDYCYPDAAERLLAAQLETVGGLLPYAYPLFRLPVEASRLTAVHNAYMAEAVRVEVPGAEVARIPMAAEAVHVEMAALVELRARLGIAPGAFVVGCFGLMTREKRIATVARALARSAEALPDVRLLLVGPVPERAALEELLARLGIRQRTVIAGRVPLSELPAHMEAADLAVHLRYPTARESSAALLRLLAQGRPTVMSDLEQLADVPDGAVLRVDPADEEGELLRAILRLAAAPGRRESLGRAARAFALREHSPARCQEAYETAIARAASRPAPPSRAWPAHWRP
jgi:glycosyltransferase involved in cell wall biosynthesis